MLGIGAVIEKVEERILEAMRDRMDIETQFDPAKLTLTTLSSFDGVVVSEYEFDLTEMVEEIVRRARGKEL